MSAGSQEENPYEQDIENDEEISIVDVGVTHKY